MNDRVEVLLAKQEIYELSCRYMRGLDRLDLDLLGSVFHADARVNYGFFKGHARDFVGFAHRALEDYPETHHMLGQALIEVDDDQATGEVYFQAFHRVVQGEKELDLFISGRYVDRYRRDDGVWKIAFRSEVNDWSRTVPAADGFFAAAPDALRGARGKADPSSDPRGLEAE